jgi:CheY-like chemotaxis protein
VSVRISKPKHASSRVLVIDDDVFITKAYSRMLRERGFRVATADDGQSGLEALARFKPDVVLLDLDMPQLNGMQWLQRIRGSSEGRKLPVIILTAGKVKSQISQAVASDATFVLSKGVVNPDTVVDAITAAAAPEGLRVYT